MRNNRGFTLIELIITMALFIAVILITTSAFESILKTSGKLVVSEESNIEGIVGLEMFRHDLQQMGYGLPSAYQVVPDYLEANSGPAVLNDSPAGVPRAVVSFDNYSSHGDYLAVKATSVGRNSTSQKWTYLTYSSTTKPSKVWSNASENLSATSRVVILDRTFSKDGKLVNTLVNSTATDWKDFTLTSMSPIDSSQTYFQYGVSDATIRMPFNRSDYYVKRPTTGTSIPSWCADNVGILYMATVNHSNGDSTEYPLLDCVADMQVVFGWDVAGNGLIDESTAYATDSVDISVAGSSSPADIQAIMNSPDEIRNKLKYVKVYLMVQDGRKDLNFTNSSKIVVGDIESITKGYDVAALTAKGWLNYRWKIYRLVIRPKNLTGS
ncbi:MAG: prepilin-type N-terminal cleavage/methylation domain-containing protein [Desulfuromonadaceae bacterium]|nr:prepilin-type N-terminal cleavage/methylation domain-containing protein [Desulfuromonadaceae bacterium]MDD5105310.1 prepilin-type N-terminal cleavage/methylation domain-containing protein [Desulfuromonadaceae bacterium]